MKRNSLAMAKSAVRKGRPWIGFLHLAAHDLGLAQVKCRRRSCRIWWYEKRKPKRPKLCAGCTNAAGLKWKEG